MSARHVLRNGGLEDTLRNLQCRRSAAKRSPAHLLAERKIVLLQFWTTTPPQFGEPNPVNGLDVRGPFCCFGMALLNRLLTTGESQRWRQSELHALQAGARSSLHS
jgi:hypothetical protein